jgi:hypothetical protein
MGGGAQRKCVRCMQWLCCGFGTKRVSCLGIFREKASRGPHSDFIIKMERARPRTRTTYTHDVKVIYFRAWRHC